MSFDSLVVKTNSVFWRNMELPHPSRSLKSPDFYIDGLIFHLESNCSWDQKSSCNEFTGRWDSVGEEKWSFALRDADNSESSDYVIIPYVEIERKYVRIAKYATSNVYYWRSELAVIGELKSDTITMLFLILSPSLSSTELNLNETSLSAFSLSKDSGKESIQTLCLKGLSEDIGKLFNNAQSADASVKCADKSFSVHRKILAARSEVFSAMFQHDLSEKNTGTVDIVDLDANVLELFLRYLYSGNVELVSMDVAIELYQAAEKYSVATLKKLCASYILDNMSKDIVYEVLILADKAGDVEFMDGITSFAVKIEGFLKSAEWKEFAKKFPNVAVNVYFKYIN